MAWMCTRSVLQVLPYESPAESPSGTASLLMRLQATCSAMCLILCSCRAARRQGTLLPRLHCMAPILPHACRHRPCPVCPLWGSLTAHGRSTSSPGRRSARLYGCLTST